MSVLKKLLGQTAIYGVSTILGRLLFLALTPLYTSVLSQGSYGIVSYLYSYVAFVNVFLTFGMETTFFRFAKDASESQKAYNHAFLWMLVLNGSFLLLGLLNYSLIADLIAASDYAHIVLMVVVIIFLDVTAALPMARLRYEEKATRFAIIYLANIIVTLGANLIFIGWLRWGIEYVFVANIIGSATKLLLVLPGTLPTSLKPDRKQLREMIDYGFFIMIAGLPGMMNEHLDKILLPNLWEDGSLYKGEPKTGEEMLGIYAANYKMAIFISLVTQAFRYAVEPFFFKEAKDKDSPETFAKIFHFFVMVCLGFFLLVSSFSKEIVSFNFWGLLDFSFIDEKFWSGLEIVPIVLLAYVFFGAYINISIWFKITKQTRFGLLFTGVGAVITILINVLTIPSYGYMGSAWATLICYAVMCVLVYYTGQRYFPVPYRIQRIFVYSLICLAAFYLNFQMGPSDDLIHVFFLKVFVVIMAVGSIGLIEWLFPCFEMEKQNG